MLNRIQEWLARAAAELGVRIVVGYVARLSDETAFPMQALFPDLGGALGMIVLDSADSCDAVTRRRLVAQGFSISTFSEPLANEEFDVGGYAEMFAEWGWTSDDLEKPDWMS